jgi:carboxyl-terminal processing protease
MPGTPAARADLRAGDVIASIDGKPTDGIELNDAVNLMRGAPGSKVSLVIERTGKRTLVELERAVITIEPVRSTRLAGEIGYLRLESYGNAATAKVKEAFAALGAIKGLVFDLRGNPGGLLQQAIEISDFFLAGGAIVTTSGPKLKEEKSAKSGDAGESVPLVVLVDGGAASATEITAGALRYNARAILVGTKTFGRGTVQSLYDLPDGAAVKLTVAQYLVAGVHAVEGVGITPDVERDAKFEEDPEKDPTVTFARQVLIEAKSADRDALLAAARHLAK